MRGTWDSRREYRRLIVLVDRVNGLDGWLVVSRAGLQSTLLLLDVNNLLRHERLDPLCRSLLHFLNFKLVLSRAYPVIIETRVYRFGILLLD